MDRMICGGSPSEKNTLIHETASCMKSPPTHRTPVKQNDRKQRQNSYTKGMTGFTVLPTHITPPSGLTKFIARNPFDADLTNRLHLSVISPTVFTKVSPTLHRDSPGFAWSVDELALIQPAKIEEYPSQQMHCSDPDLEKVAQAAIDKFFTENQIIPSPWDAGRKVQTEKIEMLTPSRPLENMSSLRESHKSKKESWAQTVLSLPPILPKEVEEALKPYFTFNQDQNVESDDANSSNNSLRRKLFFNNDDCTDDEDESSLLLSPTKSHGSMILASSPPQSGMLVHGTPLRGSSFSLQRTHGTPCPGNLSPPNMSPICNSDMSCQSIRSRYQFAARLDFTTDMSIDLSVRDDKELKRIEDFERDTNTSLLCSNVRDERSLIHPENRERIFNVEDIQDQNETTEMLSREATPLKHDNKQESNNTSIKRNEILDYLKIPVDWCKQINKNDTYPQENNTLLGNSCWAQQSHGNSAQDTGYQTYSMSNITGTTENSSIAPIAKSFNWNERILSNATDEIRLSDWQDNMKNMFSSTPSKYSRRREV